MMKDRSIVIECPCCRGELVIDLESGDVFSSDEVVMPPKYEDNRTGHYPSGITVQHATPEFNKYIDPTHIKREPLLQPITPPLKEEIEEEDRLPLPQLTDEQIEEIQNYNRIDLRNRGIIPW